jgi:hypothetical protein
MSKYWEESLGNIPNSALMATWEQMGKAFIEHINGHDDPNREDRWTVLSPPTGTGKSQGIILYCAILSQLLKEASQLHPGVLIVTRFIRGANDITADINRISRKYYTEPSENTSVAVAYHSQSEEELRRKDLMNFPVLVITHKAYTNALSSIESNYPPTIWDQFHSFLDRKRRLVVVDEVIDLVLESHLNGEEARRVLGLIPEDRYTEFRDEVRLLERLQKHIGEVSGNGDSVSASVLHNRPMLESLMLSPEGDKYFPPDFRELREAIKKTQQTQFRQGNRSTSEDIRRELDELIRDADAVWRNDWVWQTKQQGAITLSTAKLLIPEDVKGAVVLDATAGHNVFYEVFDKAKRLPVVAGTRRYDNVILHVSRGHATGKVTMGKKAKEISARLVADVERWAKGRRVLIVTHMNIEARLKKAAKRLTAEKGFTLAIAHWGAINGSNEWRDFDTVVLYGLHYLPLTWPVNVFFSCQGVQSDEWLASTRNRPFGEHKEIQEALVVGQLVTDVVQAINRICCRLVIDREGNCPKADVYVLLPKRKNREEAILSGIQEAMPGIRVREWNLVTQEKKHRKTKYEVDLIDFFREMEPGKTPVSTVKEKYSIPETTFERIRKRARERSQEDPLGEAMIEYGVSYGVVREGKIPRAYFIKEA